MRDKLTQGDWVITLLQTTKETRPQLSLEIVTYGAYKIDEHGYLWGRDIITYDVARDHGAYYVLRNFATKASTVHLTYDGFNPVTGEYLNFRGLLWDFEALVGMPFYVFIGQFPTYNNF